MPAVSLLFIKVKKFHLKSQRVTHIKTYKIRLFILFNCKIKQKHKYQIHLQINKSNVNFNPKACMLCEINPSTVAVM